MDKSCSGNTSAYSTGGAPALWRSRWYSAAKRGSICAVAGSTLLAAIAVLVMSLGGGRGAAMSIFIALPILSLAGIAWGAVKPRAYPPDRKPAALKFAAMICIVLPMALLFCVHAWAITGFFAAASGESLDGSADVYDPATTGRAGRFVAKYVPPGARNFKCEGFSGWGGSVRFSCEVGESNFLAHAAANGVELRRDDPFFNANPATTGERLGEGFVRDGTPFFNYLTGGVCPKRYWCHRWIFPNYGGWTILYDIDSGILHGHYSAN